MQTNKSKEAETKKATPWKRMRGGREYIRALYGFHYIPGNSRPYFSITADIAEPATSQNRHEAEATGEGLPEGRKFRITGGGCCHDDIRKYFPELAPLIRWHLASDEGPMHYEANGLHWMRCHLSIYRIFPSRPAEPADPKGMEHFKGTIVFGALASDEKRLRECLAAKAEGIERDNPGASVADVVTGETEDPEADEKAIMRAVAAWLPQRKRFLRLAMEKDIDRFGVERIEITA